MRDDAPAARMTPAKAGERDIPQVWVAKRLLASGKRVGFGATAIFANVTV
jgi:hypothetical protein